MRTESSDTQFRGHRSGLRLDTRLKKARKSRNCRIDLEGLESRTLLATTPAAAVATVNGSPINPMNLTSYSSATATTGGNANSPTVAINPYDSQEVVAVWGVDISNLSPTPQTTEILQGTYSLDGGTSWQTLPGEQGNGLNGVLPDPLLYTPTAPTPPFLLVEQPSIGFDSQGNFYVLDTQLHSAVVPSPSGAVTLSKYSFVGNSTSGGTGVVVDFGNKIIDQWVNGPADISAVVAVDAGTYPNTTATSTHPAGVPQDPNANKVYIAWATNDIEPADPTVVQNNFNPNRAVLLVSSNGGASFGGETVLDPGPIGNGNIGSQRNTQPALAISSTDDGQVTVAWTDIGTDEGTAVTKIKSSFVAPGVSYSSTPTSTSTGIIGAPVSGTDARGNWATTVSTAGNNGQTVDPTAVAASVPVTGTTNDIVVADQSTTPSDGIGFLLNSGTGTFPANATFTAGGSTPTSVTVGNFIPNPVPPPAPATTVDAALADDNAQGGVTVIPSDGMGNFTGAQTTFTTTTPYTVAVASGVFNSAGLSIVAVNGGNAAGTDPSIDIILHNAAGGSPPIDVPIPAADLAGLNDPRAVVVADFNGDGVPDFAVLSGNPTNSADDYITVFVNTTISGGLPTFTNVTQFNVGPGAVAFAAGHLTGNAILTDLAVVFNTLGALDLRVLQNTSTAAGTNFATHVITGSVFPGTAVGVATGTLYSAPTGGYQDIAVVYAADGTTGVPVGESMVRVFQNSTIGFGFPVTPDPLTGGDYDAGATLTGMLTVNSNTVTGLATTQGLFQGELVYGTGIPAGTTIQSIASATSITLTKNATITSPETLTASEINPTGITVSGLGASGGAGTASS